MHELSIALCLVDVVSEELSRLGPVRVEAIRVRIGALSGVVTDALRFSFEAAIAGTALQGARLQIEDVPVTVWCRACDAERTLKTVALRRCPVCNEVTPQIVRGEELELIGLEVVDG